MKLEVYGRTSDHIACEDADASGFAVMAGTRVLQTFYVQTNGRDRAACRDAAKVFLKGYEAGQKAEKETAVTLKWLQDAADEAMLVSRSVADQRSTMKADYNTVATRDEAARAAATQAVAAVNTYKREMGLDQ